MFANDEFFAEASNLLLASDPVWRDGEYTDRGKWMDGWETRRRREPGNDFCVIKLGIPGRISRAIVQTTFFRGNHPEACSIGGLWAPDAGGPELAQRDDWRPILTRSDLRGDSTHEFEVDESEPCTHVRLDIFPDGGVARLRLLGTPEVDWRPIADAVVDLASVRHGGTIVEASDGSFGNPQNMLLPGRSTHMGEGWETRRRRGPGHDWAVARLGRPGTVDRVEICTEHFKGNCPAEAEVHLRDSRAGGDTGEWHVAVPRTRLDPDHHHVFDDLEWRGPATHAKLSIFPDGGVARFRVFGRVEASE